MWAISGSVVAVDFTLPNCAHMNSMHYLLLALRASMCVHLRVYIRMIVRVQVCLIVCMTLCAHVCVYMHVWHVKDLYVGICVHLRVGYYYMCTWAR